MICTTCNDREVDIKLYNKENRKSCRKCYNLKSWRRTIKKRYGITLEEYNKCMATSDSCEHCGSTTYLCYDHDHKTMKFRGVLCRTCNRGLGNIGDTLEDVIRMKEYLER